MATTKIDVLVVGTTLSATAGLLKSLLPSTTLIENKELGSESGGVQYRSDTFDSNSLELGDEKLSGTKLRFISTAFSNVLEPHEDQETFLKKVVCGLPNEIPADVAQAPIDSTNAIKFIIVTIPLSSLLIVHKGIVFCALIEFSSYSIQ